MLFCKFSENGTKKLSIVKHRVHFLGGNFGDEIVQKRKVTYDELISSKKVIQLLHHFAETV